MMERYRQERANDQNQGDNEEEKREDQDNQSDTSNEERARSRQTQEGTLSTSKLSTYNSEISTPQITGVLLFILFT